MPEKCDKNIKVVVYLNDAECEFQGKDLREIINLIDNSVKHIPQLEESIANFIYKFNAVTREKYKDI